MEIKDTIRALRESHNLSQEDFGKIAGVSGKAVSTWENGTRIPRMGAIQKIASYFGIKKSNIIGDNEESYIPDLMKFLESNEKRISSTSLDEKDIPTEDLLLRALQNLGFIRSDRTLTEADFKFLSEIITFIESLFAKQKEESP